MQSPKRLAWCDCHTVTDATMFFLLKLKNYLLKQVRNSKQCQKPFFKKNEFSFKFWWGKTLANK